MKTPFNIIGVVNTTRPLPSFRMTIWIGFPNRHAENIRIYIKLMGEGGFPTPLKTGASDPLRIMLRCVMLVEASASICATGYNQDLRR